MLTVLLLAYALFVYYLAYVAIIYAKRTGALDRMRWYARYAIYSVAFTAAVLDVLFNVLVGTLLFLELPRQLLFTTRCERHMKSKKWRGKLARWFCESWLNPIQENHCH